MCVGVYVSACAHTRGCHGNERQSSAETRATGCTRRTHVQKTSTNDHRKYITISDRNNTVYPHILVLSLPWKPHGKGGKDLNKSGGREGGWAAVEWHEH